MTSRHVFLRSAAFTTAALLAGLAIAPAASAQDAAAANAPPSSSDETMNPEAIVVTANRRVAGGLMKLQTAPEAMSSVTGDAIKEKLSVASPLQLVSTIPGVNFGSSDAYGLSVRNFLSVRGLDQTEIGFLVENIPGVDLQNYFPFSESWADNENVADITLTPGNSRLQDPIINASGGEMIMTIRNPRNSFGGTVSGSYGSYDGWRAFGAIDTGQIGHTGVTAFGSFSHTSAGNYVGPGRNTRDHVDFKVAKDWSPSIHSTLFFSYNNWYNARIPPLNLAQSLNGIANGFDQYAYSATYTPGVTSSYYKLLAVQRKTFIVSSNNDFDISDKIKLHITPYYRHANNTNPGQAALTPTSIFSGSLKVSPVYSASDLQNGKLVVQNNVLYKQNQYGVNAWLEADLTSHNHLMFGYWHETWDLDTVAPLFLVSSTGGTSGLNQAGALHDTSGRLITGTNASVQTDTNQVFIGDTQAFLDDRLKISVGFKNLFYKVSGTNRALGTTPGIDVSWSRPMPRILASFDVDPHVQMYANLTTNARMPNVFATYLTTYNVATGAAAAVGTNGPKPEYTVSGQFGMRYHGFINIDGNAFYMHLKNHQVSSLQYINGSLLSTAISAGAETIRGASLEVSSHSYYGFSLYGSGQYLNGTFDDNIAVGADFLPTRHKQMVQSPHWNGNVGLRFQNGGFFAELTGKYVSKQYATFMNDQLMPSYTIFDLGLGYKLPNFAGLKSPTVRVNMTNLGNKAYISSVATVTTNAVATRGINGTTITGGTPLYYASAPRAVMATISTDF